MNIKDVKEILWRRGEGRCSEVIGWLKPSDGMPWGGVAQVIRFFDGTESRRCCDLEAVEQTFES